MAVLPMLDWCEADLVDYVNRLRGKPKRDLLDKTRLVQAEAELQFRWDALKLPGANPKKWRKK